MKSISQSQINLYSSCPHAYELKYRYKCEPMFYNPTVFEVGKAVHDAIDYYYKHCYVKSNDKATVLALTYRYLRDNWDTSLPVDYLKKAHHCLCNFAEFEVNNSHELATKPLTEIKIYANDVMGIIDYVDLNNRKFIDWKINAKTSLGYTYKVQAIMYKKLIKHQFNIDIEEFDFLFLFLNETKTVKFKYMKLDVIEQNMLDCKESIKESWETLNFPKEPKTEKTCKWCNYRYYCEEM